MATTDLRPGKGCIMVGCGAAAGGSCCFGLLTFVLLFANSSRMVWGMSGSNLTPCCSGIQRQPLKISHCGFYLHVFFKLFPSDNFSNIWLCIWRMSDRFSYIQSYGNSGYAFYHRNNFWWYALLKGYRYLGSGYT